MEGLRAQVGGNLDLLATLVNDQASKGLPYVAAVRTPTASHT